MKKSDQWPYFIIDDDAKTFCNMGLVSSEVEYNLKIVVLQRAGRTLRTDGGRGRNAANIESYYLGQGYRKVDKPPLDAPQDAETSKE